jgi:catechol-2,3-dioxygenase
MAVTGLNHAVLWVRDAPATAAFFGRHLGFVVVGSDPAGRAVFLRAPGSTHHHDLGVFTVGDRPSATARSPGLYHLAWQVPTIDDLVPIRASLLAEGALVGESDHGVSKSLYARDPDGIEFEVMWLLPSDRWAGVDDTMIAPLDLDAEVRRWSGVVTAG